MKKRITLAATALATLVNANDGQGFGISANLVQLQPGPPPFAKVVVATPAKVQSWLPEGKKCIPAPKYCSPEPKCCPPAPKYCPPEEKKCTPAPKYCPPEEKKCTPAPKYCPPAPKYCSPEPKCYPAPKYCPPPKCPIVPAKKCVAPAKSVTCRKRSNGSNKSCKKSNCSKDYWQNPGNSNVCHGTPKYTGCYNGPCNDGYVDTVNISGENRQTCDETITHVHKPLYAIGQPSGCWDLGSDTDSTSSSNSCYSSCSNKRQKNKSCKVKKSCKSNKSCNKPSSKPCNNSPDYSCYAPCKINLYSSRCKSLPQNTFSIIATRCQPPKQEQNKQCYPLQYACDDFAKAYQKQNLATESKYSRAKNDNRYF